jgi:lipopolysaccharide/colanic/teichoic acid biosynthesis glycosyltransferase
VTKRGFDLCVTLALLVLSSPLLGLVAVAVRIGLGRPVLFHQLRAGKAGIPFTLVKFRTMRPPLFAGGEMDDDEQRLTRLGMLLRTSSLDELPTLVNVLRGDMSLVGPRPLPVEYTERYSPQQRRRLEVLPGVTGLAQVSGRNTLIWEDKFDLDVRYVDSQSFLLDLKILVRTVGVVLRRTGIAMEGHTSAPRFVGRSVIDAAARPSPRADLPIRADGAGPAS